MVNFTISEGGDSPQFLEKFIELYYNPDLRVVDIYKELDISQHKYRRIRDELVEKGMIEKSFRTRKPLYITYNRQNDSYRIVKSNIYYMEVQEKKDALKAVKLFDKYGWDKKNVNKVKSDLRGSRNVYPSNNRRNWYVQKMIDSEYRYGGCFKNKRDAELRAKELDENGWVV